ncbi:MAG: DUF1841 family protein [Gammaproteobacteria bacterium]
MIYGQDRGAMRRVFVEAWRKRRAAENLEPLERQIADIVAMHTEYHSLLEDGAVLQREFLPDGGAVNPFLHLGLHVALHEQVATDRPAGVRELYAAIARRHGDVHGAEHAMMDCLSAALFAAQSCGQPPDETAYLAALRALLER